MVKKIYLIVLFVASLSLFGCAGIKYMNNIQPIEDNMAKDMDIATYFSTTVKNSKKIGDVSLQTTAYARIEEYHNIISNYCKVNGKIYRKITLPEKKIDTTFSAPLDLLYPIKPSNQEYVVSREYVFPNMGADLYREYQKRIDNWQSLRYRIEMVLYEIIKDDNIETVEYVALSGFNADIYAIAFSKKSAEAVYKSIKKWVDNEYVRRMSAIDELNTAKESRRDENKKYFTDPKHIERRMMHDNALKKAGFSAVADWNSVYKYKEVAPSKCTGFVEFKDRNFNRYLVPFTAILSQEGDIQYSFGEIIMSRERNTPDYYRPWPGF